MSTWQRITATEPPPLEDVLVTVCSDIDEEPYVLMAWRRHTDPGGWCYSGFDDEVHGRVTHWMPIPDPHREVAHARGPDGA
ncbi:DUF551 domain-containing protein [Thermomonas sp.]|uniref:DUF551 domain-containing protein n=1 Tax=Thermomonas sp. TaxID=1971895 RepID=UPI003D1376DB